MTENAVEIKNVTMHFNMSKEKIDSLKEYVIKFLKGQLHYDEFTALDNISFEIQKGEVFGIIGFNGAGKSTLLKIISGILKPSLGMAKTYGSIAPLIELGAGFDMELTARENIFLNASILGYSKKFIISSFEEIVEFAELREFLDVPMKNYSSGMVARIGFGIATVINPDILIIDEILSVGDFLFQQKCENRIKEIMDNGTTIIIVSHSIDQIRRLCDRVILLDRGKIKMIGATKEVCENYENA
ncbi:MAG: ABC transporter ATP-binding protein [Eubacteriales bacterium]